MHNISRKIQAGLTFISAAAAALACTPALADALLSGTIKTPDGKPLNMLAIAQDIGGAIRGAVRSDIFFGFGNRAETLAGEMKQSGRMYVLIPKSVKGL